MNFLFENYTPNVKFWTVEYETSLKLDKYLTIFNSVFPCVCSPPNKHGCEWECQCLESLPTYIRELEFHPSIGCCYNNKIFK
jgi:hypothetical protein